MGGGSRLHPARTRAEGGSAGSEPSPDWQAAGGLFRSYGIPAPDWIVIADLAGTGGAISTAILSLLRFFRKGSRNENHPAHPPQPDWRISHIRLANSWSCRPGTHHECHGSSAPAAQSGEREETGPSGTRPAATEHFTLITNHFLLPAAPHSGAGIPRSPPQSVAGPRRALRCDRRATPTAAWVRWPPQSFFPRDESR